MLRSNPEQQASGPGRGAAGLQARILGQIAERQQNSAKANQVWVEILEDRVSIGGYRLEAVLQSVEERLGVDARILRSERKIIGGIRGFFGRECFVVEAALPEVTLPEEASPEVAPPEVAPIEEAPIEEALPEVMVPKAAPVEATPTETGTSSGPDFARALAQALSQVERAESTLVASAGTFLSLEANSLPREELARRVTDLVAEVADTPRSGIAAVVGDPDECVASARALAEREGIDPGEVLVMSPEPVPGHPSWMCVTSTDECAKRRERWLGDKRLHIVAVVVNAGPAGMEWACASLDALSPDVTRLAVPGWRSADEVAGRLRSLAPIAAVDLMGPTSTETAIGFLDAGVPVGTIDGQVATVELWCSQITGTHLEQVLLDQLLTASSGVENLR